MQKRITIFDTVRGFTMLSMAGFHACYDLALLASDFFSQI
ncbi:heparan-alpha-glucosaminide N-acetyltransferase domain-containing protein [Collinsella aerofaciens]